jgi:AsmA protein
MKKLLKWSGICIGGFLVLIVLAMLIVQMFYDSGKLKPLIERTVETATGRELILGGDVKLSLFPWVGVALTDVSLGNPKGFGEKPFAAFSEFEVRVKL